MPDDTPPPSGIEIAPGLFVPEAILQFSFSRSGGPGGQNVNKVSSKARLAIALKDLQPRLARGTFERLAAAAASRINDAGELVITSDESRSQHENRAICLQRLRTILLEARRVPRVRRATKPSKASKQRRLGEKKRRSEVKRGRGSVGESE
jgi:ribosome-associated protein